MVLGGRTGSGRRARLLLAAALLASLTIPISSVSTAAGACDPHHPQADLALQQGASSPRAGVVSYQLNVVNLGPCNADGVVFTDTLPAGASLDSFRASPSSMQCVALPPEPGSDIRCKLTASVGVPGNVSLELLATLPSGSAITNQASVSFSGATTDPDDRNNGSYGAFVGAQGGTVGTGPLIPEDESNQVILPAGVSGTVGLSRGHLDDPCPPAFPTCSGRPINITSPASTSTSGPIKLIFDKDATLLDNPRSQLFIIYLPDDSQNWIRIGKCKGGRVYPCLSSTARMSDSTLKSPANPKGFFYRLTVLTLHTSRWR
jgi:hypothetical protein